MPVQQHTPAQAPAPDAGQSQDQPSGAAYEQPRGNAAAQEAMQAEVGHDHERSPEGDEGGVRAGAPTSKAGALRRHQRNVDKMHALFRSGRAQQPDPNAGPDSRINLLRNTIAWLDEGEADLYVMSPIHDSHLRPGVAADKLGYFDDRVTYEAGGADYDDSLDASNQATNDAGIKVKRPTVTGSMALNGTDLFVYDPHDRSDGDVARTLIHEVQHDADQHRNGEWDVSRPPADPNAVKRAPSWAYNSYQSEFRAYWLRRDDFGDAGDTSVTDFDITAIAPGPDGSTGTADDVSNTVSTAFTNKRQEDIFRHLYNERTDDIYYDYAAGAWNVSYGFLPHYYALDPAFKTMVDDYTEPVGGNLINSPRIQALSETIADGDDFTDELEALDQLDINYLANRTQARPFWDQASDDLGAAELQTLEAHVDGNVLVGPTPRTVTVVEGDSLWALADRYLSDSSRWREIYRLNRDEIGDDPDLIQPGQVLDMPVIE